MLINILKERKDMLVFILMFIIFTCFAIIRVDHLEKESINHEISNKIVYNR